MRAYSCTIAKVRVAERIIAHYKQISPVTHRNEHHIHIITSSSFNDHTHTFDFCLNHFQSEQQITSTSQIKFTNATRVCYLMMVLGRLLLLSVNMRTTWRASPLIIVSRPWWAQYFFDAFTLFSRCCLCRRLFENPLKQFGLSPDQHTHTLFTFILPYIQIPFTIMKYCYSLSPRSVKDTQIIFDRWCWWCWWWSDETGAARV